jgi:hypothetical protein
MRIAAGILVILPLLVGGSPPATTLNSIGAAACPFAYDPNLVEGRLLGWLQVEVGRSITHTRTWYDADEDEGFAEIVKGPPRARLIYRPKVRSYTILWTPQEPQTTAVVVKVTDKPQTGVPKSDTGTILIQVLPHQRRQAPRFCGGPPQ